MRVPMASSGSNNSYVAVTPWIPTIAAAKMRAALSITSLTGDFQCRMAYRTAETSQQSPNGWSTTFDSTWRTAGEATTNDLTPTYSDVMWVQFGLQYNLSSGTPGQASVACAVAVQK